MPRSLWMLNQPGVLYPAEEVRGATYSNTSGGTGVSGPGDFKVVAQAAPNGTVQVRTGGAVIRSTYTTRPESYQATNFTTFNLDVPPVGSAGSRTDLVIIRCLDPQHEQHPAAPSGITPQIAPTLDYWWVEVLQGRTNTTGITYPHVVLAKITRPANTTIVTSAHITDMRRIAAPRTDRFFAARNLNVSETQSVHTGSVVWPAAATQTVRVPEYATRVAIFASWGTIRGSAGNAAKGTCYVALVHPDGTSIGTQTSVWSVPESTSDVRFTVNLGHTMILAQKWRGQDVRVEMRATKESGPNAYMDGGSSYVLDMQWVQGTE